MGRDVFWGKRLNIPSAICRHGSKLWKLCTSIAAKWIKIEVYTPELWYLNPKSVDEIHFNPHVSWLDPRISKVNIPINPSTLDHHHPGVPSGSERFTRSATGNIKGMRFSYLAELDFCVNGYIPYLWRVKSQLMFSKYPIGSWNIRILKILRVECTWEYPIRNILLGISYFFPIPTRKMLNFGLLGDVLHEPNK